MNGSHDRTGFPRFFRFLREHESDSTLTVANKYSKSFYGFQCPCRHVVGGCTPCADIQFDCGDGIDETNHKSEQLPIFW